jgi:hypothetical protein
MNYWIALVSVLIGCLLCSPIFLYVYNVTIKNRTDFQSGYRKEFNSDATEDFVNDKLGDYNLMGSNDDTVNRFAYANAVVLLLPFIPSLILAVPVYLLIEWLFVG